MGLYTTAFSLLEELVLSSVSAYDQTIGIDSAAEWLEQTGFFGESLTATLEENPGAGEVALVLGAAAVVFLGPEVLAGTAAELLATAAGGSALTTLAGVFETFGFSEAIAATLSNSLLSSVISGAIATAVSSTIETAADKLIDTAQELIERLGGESTVQPSSGGFTFSIAPSQQVDSPSMDWPTATMSYTQILVVSDDGSSTELVPGDDGSTVNTNYDANGGITSTVTDYSDGRSQVTIVGSDGTTSTTYYGSPDGTGYITQINQGANDVTIDNPTPIPDSLIVPAGTGNVWSNFDGNGTLIDISTNTLYTIADSSSGFQSGSVLIVADGRVVASFPQTDGFYEAYRLGSTVSIESIYGTGQFPPEAVIYSFTPTDGGFLETSDLGQSTLIPCFRLGTRIHTREGPRPVEELLVGDYVQSATGKYEAIIWIGHREVNCSRHPHPEQVWPICVMADAFRAGQPRRDLYLSPDHAIYVEDVLIPVKQLINGTTIRQVEVDKTIYYHIELQKHEVIYAEGMPCESYLDTGDRASFSNVGGVVDLHPAWASEARDIALLMDAIGYAPLRVNGAEVDNVRALLAARHASAPADSPQRNHHGYVPLKSASANAPPSPERGVP